MTELIDGKCASCERLMIKVYPETELCYFCAMTKFYYEGSKFDE